MLISYNWLQRFFEEPLPEPKDLADTLTFHAWEIDDVISKPEQNDTVLDVKVLPDKAAWALSHRGIAKDIATLLNRTLFNDPYKYPDINHDLNLDKKDIAPVTIETAQCDRYMLARIDDIKIGPSPEWLRNLLEALGQRSINNVVDATNYVLLAYGQPTHVFDADKVSGIHVRAAYDGEEIETLGGDARTLSPIDTVIADAPSDAPLAIGGVKGGTHAEVTAATTSVYLEVAHFDAAATRKTASRLGLRTDASVRYENGVPAAIVPIGMRELVRTITDIAAGTCVGYTEINNANLANPKPVSCSFERLDRVLGYDVSPSAVADIFARFGYEYAADEEVFTVTPSFERFDLAIPEDLIEEVVRVHGLEHIPSILPESAPLLEENTRFIASQKLRAFLTDHGFSEVYTSSFRKKDTVKLKNALASDKGYLRSSLVKNMDEVLAKNVPNCDLLGVREIRAFEIGTVFNEETEHFVLCLGVRGPSGFKQKIHGKIMDDVAHGLSGAFNITYTAVDGIAEVALTPERLEHIASEDTSVPEVSTNEPVQFKPFSTYPAISRDIALWTDGEESGTVLRMLGDAEPQYLIRTDLVDRYEKDGRVSYAFRFVFQASDRTLTDEEVNTEMDKVYQAALTNNWETR